SNHQARIVSEFPSQLAMTTVEREYFGRAALQQAIGKSAGGRANIERGLSLNIDAEKIERTAKFQRAATSELRRVHKRSRGVDFNQLGRFAEYAVPHPDFARH